MRQLPAKVWRSIEWILGGAARGDKPGRYEQADAKTALEAIASARKPKRGYAGGKARQAQRKAGVKAEWAAIVEKVVARSGGRCERLGNVVTSDGRCPRMAVDPAHAFGGKDRRTLQSKFTVRHLCRPCHDWEHANPIEAVRDFIGWANAKYVATGDRGYQVAADVGHTKLRWLEAKAPKLPGVDANGSEVA